MSSRPYPAARRALAHLLVVAMLSLATPTFAAPSSSVSGAVVVSGSAQPIAGARVHAANAVDGSIVTSEPTGADGRFRIAELEPGTYELGVESQGGLYLVREPVRIEPDQARPMLLSIAPAKSGGAIPPAPDGEIVEEHKKRMGLWNNPGMATLVIVGIAFAGGYVLNEVFEDDSPPPELPASPM